MSEFEGFLDKFWHSRKVRTAYLLLLSLVAAVLITFYMIEDINRIEAFISSSGVWGILVAVLIYVLLSVTPIPSEPFTIFMGATVGPVVATLIAGTGNLLGAFVQYSYARRVGRVANFRDMIQRLPWGIGNMPVSSPYFLIGSRIIPAYGPKVANLFAGVYHVPLSTFLWTSALPSYIGAALFAFGGFGIIKLF